MVNVIVVSSNRIPAAFSGFRIAQVSDLHNAEFGDGNAELLNLLFIGQKAKNFRGDFDVFVLHLCLSFPKSSRFVPSARKMEIFCRYKKIDTYL